MSNAKRSTGGIPAWPYRLGSVLVLAIAWEVAARLANAPLTFPLFTKVVASIGKLLVSAQLWEALGLSLPSLGWGLGVSILVGVPLGLLLGRFPSINRVARTYLDILNSVPVAPLVPLMVIFLGIDLAARTAVIILFTFPVIVMNVTAGVTQVPPHLPEMARAFCATEVQIFRDILLPGSLPSVMAGLRIGVGRAVVGMVVSELIIMSVGIGKLVSRFSNLFKSADLFAVVLLIMLLGVILIKGLEHLESRLVRWRHGEEHGL